jgi:hypothetical protein
MLLSRRVYGGALSMLICWLSIVDFPAADHTTKARGAGVLNYVTTEPSVILAQGVDGQPMP